MPITAVEKDLDKQTMVVKAEYEAPIDKVWQLWADPRKLERWWGPPSWPATFVDYDLSPGGHVSYFMTGPEGEKSHGWWKVKTVDAPNGFSFEDGFADENGKPNDDLPTSTIAISLSESAGKTHVHISTTFPTREAMEKILEMGAEEGMREAMSQIEAVLAA